MGILQALIELVAHLDVIEPLLGLVHGRGHRFEIRRDGGYSGAQVEAMLKERGIKIWSRGFTRDRLRFRVKDHQAGWAQYVMDRNGVDVLDGAVPAARARPEMGPMPGDEDLSWLEQVADRLLDL